MLVVYPENIIMIGNPCNQGWVPYKRILLQIMIYVLNVIITLFSEDSTDVSIIKKIDNENIGILSCEQMSSDDGSGAVNYNYERNVNRL